MSALSEPGPEQDHAVTRHFGLAALGLELAFSLSAQHKLFAQAS